MLVRINRRLIDTYQTNPLDWSRLAREMENEEVVSIFIPLGQYGVKWEHEPPPIERLDESWNVVVPEKGSTKLSGPVKVRGSYLSNINGIEVRTDPEGEELRLLHQGPMEDLESRMVPWVLVESHEAVQGLMEKQTELRDLCLSLIVVVERVAEAIEMTKAHFHSDMLAKIRECLEDSAKQARQELGLEGIEERA